MNDQLNSTFETARAFFEESLAVQQLLRAFPEGTDLSVSLEDRMEARLHLHEGAARLTAEPAKNADFKACFYSESLRRLSAHPPGGVVELLRELSRETLAGQIKWSVLNPWSEIKKHDYVGSIKKLGPQVQAEALSLGLQVAGQAQFLFESLKSRFRGGSGGK